MAFSRGRALGLELIDGPVESRSELAQSFSDIAFANRYFGGTAAVRYAMKKHRAAETILDVGTGGADIPLALAADARRDNRPVRITCVDVSEDVLDIARARTRGHPSIEIVRGDGRRLDFPDRSFDVAMCNLTLHHLDPERATALLSELRRVSRASPLVTDLYRSFGSWLATLAFSRLCSQNRLTRHDAPLSARRAYTPAEALALARTAGWRNPRAYVRPFFRMVMVDEAR